MLLIKKQIGNKDEEIKELKILIKEQEIRYNHIESLFQKEKQEKENNAIIFKRIL